MSKMRGLHSLYEEAAEARNKHFRMFRYNFARKFSRTNCNFDVLYRLLLSSDPLLSSLRPKPTKKSQPFSKETIHMLLPADPKPEVYNFEESEAEEDEESDVEPWHLSSFDIMQVILPDLSVIS
ncbi:uncharacterized protein [Leptinotarsa decemlineata]|uniref:uncharacterized protein n=1 Tax=Leptinotarsa decemlineata TaxID=7539 RepID=UPI003D304C18